MSIDTTKMASDEQRFEQYKNSIESKQRREKADLEKTHLEDMADMIQRFDEEKKSLQEAFDVKLSATAEELAERAERIKYEQSRTVEDLQKQADERLAVHKKTHQEALRAYQSKADKELERKKIEHKQAMKTLHEETNRDLKQTARANQIKLDEAKKG